MARYNKSALRLQRNKYYEAIEKINSAIKKFEIIIEKLSDKNKYSGISGLDSAKGKIESTINDLKSSKIKLDSTITRLTTEIDKPDEEPENEILGGEV